MATLTRTLVIRPRPTGLRRTLLKRQLSQPLVIISLIVLAVGIGRAITDRSSFPGTLTLVWLPVLTVLAFSYLQLYYRKVSWGIVDGQLVRTGVLLPKRCVPIALIRQFVSITPITRSGGSSVVLVVGDDNRCLATITASDEYLRSDLEALAHAAQVALVDRGPMEFGEFAHRYPGAAPRLQSVASTINAHGTLASLIFGMVVVIAFVIYEIVRRG